MFNKSKKLISLNVEKHNNIHHAIVAGEANGSLVKKVLKTLDKCHYIWTNGEMNNVSESAGLLSASLPFMALTSVGSAINNAVLKPLARAVGFKGLRCKKRKHKCEDEHHHHDDEDMDSEDDEDMDSEYDDDDECEDDEEDMDSDHEHDKNGGCRKLNVKSKSVNSKSVKPKNVKKHKK